MRTNIISIFMVLGLVVLSPAYSSHFKKQIGSDKTYHVSPRGSDKNRGIPRKPLRTISAAALLAMPGDTVLVYEGIYREQVSPPRGGLSENERITYMAAPGEKVVITGSEVITGWKKLDNDTWTVSVPNTLFGNFNPYNDLISGDWFNDKGRKHHTGAVYLNGVWLKEAAKKDQVMLPAEKNNSLWFAEANETTTQLWAHFPGVDPNKESVEINVRQTVFYPEKPFINYITVRGFTMQNAATNWAPPSSEQKAVIGTHWSKGWIIEDNIVRYSKCTGITLGKYGDEYDNKTSNTAEGYVGTIYRALDFGWNKETVGGHIVRNNTISNCEQAGIVGSMGCAFSVVEGNVIHDIYRHKLFSGAEQAAIKFHGAIDTRIVNNQVYNANLAIWLDWMSQGTQVLGNLLHSNDYDLYLEVNHGPTLIANNILLSRTSVRMKSSGAAFVHNLIGGRIEAFAFNTRKTPYHKPHSTEIVDLEYNPSGSVQFYNNLFVRRGDASMYKWALMPVIFDGDVYTKGTLMAVQGVGRDMNPDADGFDERSQEAFNKYKKQDAVIRNTLAAMEFDAVANLRRSDQGVFLEIALDENWLAQKRELVTTDILPNALIPDLPYVNPDGSPIRINTDYFGTKRNNYNPSPGPFEIRNSGKQTIQIWPIN